MVAGMLYSLRYLVEPVLLSHILPGQLEAAGIQEGTPVLYCSGASQECRRDLGGHAAYVKRERQDRKHVYREGSTYLLLSLQ